MISKMKFGIEDQKMIYENQLNQKIRKQKKLENLELEKLDEKKKKDYMLDYEALEK
jgi:hypothetical protein